MGEGGQNYGGEGGQNYGTWNLGNRLPMPCDNIISTTDSKYY